MAEGWIGVDLDGTLAHYSGWSDPDHIGEPIPAALLNLRLNGSQREKARVPSKDEVVK